MRFFDALCEALWDETWSANSPAFKDAVKVSAVLGAWSASVDLGPSWLVRSFSHLALLSIDGTRAPCPDWCLLLEDMAGAAVESYQAVMRQQEQERFDKHLELHTPLVRLQEGLPGLFVIGSPSASLWEALLDRLLTEAVRTGAVDILVDLTHSDLPIPPLLESLERFADHKHVRQRRVFICGLPTDLPLPRSNLQVVASVAQALAEFERNHDD